jgi:glycosyltransferase involved in cell wall biosynthesis
VTLPSEISMVLVHSSDELYGADRMVLQIAAVAAPAVRLEVWLPTDLPHPAAPLCAELTARGIAVRHLPLPVIRRAYLNPRGVLSLIGRTVAVLRALRAARPTVLYCATSAVLLTAPIGRMLRVPRVVVHLQEIWSRSDRMVLGALAGCCHRLVAISSAAADSLPGRVRGSAIVVPNATPEPGRVVPLQGRSGPLTFLVASRWNAWKGHRTLLTAWSRAGAPGRLLVLGGPPPSGSAVEVPVLVRAFERWATVQIVGEVPDPERYVERADVVLMPSDQPEPFGLVAIEALARGRPVIASDGGGLREIITDGQDGWLFPPGDAGALASLLASLDRNRVNAAAQVALRSYRERYRPERFGADWRSAVLSGVPSR